MYFTRLFFANNEDQPKQVIPEAAYKLLAKMLQYLFPVYIDKKSKDQLIQLNSYLTRLGCGGQSEQQPAHYAALKQVLASLELHANMAISSHHVK
jgi:hypothetical protein